ncbi:hypothetical protein ACD591_20475 [Rufibacter glacialis]|uniref:Uncharacterized protein n=1 Tax=Rufibacter glacialis TaxID=1259555 RepID=A0A5M8Q8S1_9BACT|nr:hypothetical protein [Rufibacter glacialis]KAA6432269.1 hypothetical protein FOE74_14245 [Rufibacter glacialis]GGK77279.1 hypothetical protein GCM10011405_26320 [Rufibacter glacialis]
MEFKPPISARETDDLIRIANFPDNWNPLAVEQAKKELLIRNVPIDYENKKVAVLNRYDQKRKEIAAKRRAREAFEWHDFMFDFHHVLLEMLCDWDMKKNGYITKHRQRKYTLSIISLLILIIYVYWNFIK